ncbi:MAG TPA: hypothetical protein VGQ69_11230 [Gemmatimonadales bacterium]|jgi:hypothetical protein|nr:hypothetical protein [Gemmatimonadales bacterium]
MRSGYLGLGSALLFSLVSAGSASAQRVSADIRIGGRGPVSGHVRIDSHDHYRDRYYRDYGYRPRLVRVDVIRRHDHGRHNGWFRQFQRKARVVVVYYDRRDDCYYDRRFYPGLEEIRVYERDGRYYRPDDRDWDDRYDDRRYDGRYDDWYDGRERRDGWDDRDRRGGRDGWDDGDRREGRNW